MDKVLKFLKDAETYYLATVEGDQPRVRPLEQYMFLKESFPILYTVFWRC